MTSSHSFFAHWYFHVPNLVMAGFICILIGRLLLELLFARKQDAGILRLFRAVTRPVVGAVRAITPAVAPDRLVIALAAFWLLALRMVWFLVCVAAGVRPSLGA